MTDGGWDHMCLVALHLSRVLCHLFTLHIDGMML
uniref:Uncharacterized protein n=1 Tax=Amphimedon queenslandica TaxID=400682 RepID=A0A1X7TNL4_AMPQE